MTTKKHETTPIDGDELREAMRYWATGVTVVTSTVNQARHGMTVSSFTSLSLAPPLVMVSLEKATRTHELVMESNAFGVTVLNQGQQEVSNRFAGRDTEGGDRFEGLAVFDLTTGSPFLQDGQAFFDCRVTVCHDAGTHTVVIGEVVAAKVGENAEDKPPLLYYNRDYRGLNDMGKSK